MKNLILTTLAALSLAVASPALATAAPTPCPGPNDNNSKQQVLKGVSRAGQGCDDSKFMNTIATIVNILSLITGIVAIIMIIVSGLRYITSAGDSGKVSAAKSTLIYALVGVAIAGLAQLLVHFVLYQTNN